MTDLKSMNLAEMTVQGTAGETEGALYSLPVPGGTEADLRPGRDYEISVAAGRWKLH